MSAGVHFLNSFLSMPSEYIRLSDSIFFIMQGQVWHIAEHILHGRYCTVSCTEWSVGK